MCVHSKDDKSGRDARFEFLAHTAAAVSIAGVSSPS
jgi:hypothetical protein